MNKIKVLVDMDGVLCDYTRHFLEKAVEKGAPKKDPLDCMSFGMDKNFEKKHHELIKDIPFEVGFFENHPPIEGALEAVRKMALDERIDIFICTAPKKQYKNCVGEKYVWVEKNLGIEFTTKIIMTKDKTMVCGDFLIDDKEVILGKNQNPSWEHLIFERPYNKNSSSEKRKITWENWEEVIFSK
jgi:5'-nucleotidase